MPGKNSEFGFAMVDAARALVGGGGGGRCVREGTALMNEQDSGPELEGLVQVSTDLFPPL